MTQLLTACGDNPSDFASIVRPPQIEMARLIGFMCDTIRPACIELKRYVFDLLPSLKGGDSWLLPSRFLFQRQSSFCADLARGGIVPEITQNV